MNKIQVFFFATLKEKAATSKIELEIPEGTLVSHLKDLLLEKFPSLPRSKANLVVAINREFAFDGEPIPPAAEIAVFPPVSGG